MATAAVTAQAITAIATAAITAAAIDTPPIAAASLIGGCISGPVKVIGCISSGTLSNRSTLLQVQAFYQLPATGIVRIVALLTDKVTSSKKG